MPLYAKGHTFFVPFGKMFPDLVLVLHHLKSLSPYLSQNIFMSNSELAVDFFFVLSGFVISLNYFYKLNDFNIFFDFIKKRFLRLYPLHFLKIVCLAY